MHKKPAMDPIGKSSPGNGNSPPFYSVGVPIMCQHRGMTSLVLTKYWTNRKRQILISPLNHAACSYVISQACVAN